MKLCQVCLFFDSETCGAPATLECTYGAGPARHYRCDAHAPPEGWFVEVRRIFVMGDQPTLRMRFRDELGHVWSLEALYAGCEEEHLDALADLVIGERFGNLTRIEDVEHAS